MPLYKKDSLETSMQSNDGLAENNKKSIKDIQVPNSIAIILILGVIFSGYLFYLSSKKDNIQTSAGTQIEENSTGDEDAFSVEVLPQVERNFGQEDKNPFLSEDLSNVVLTGIITSVNSSMAILETPVSSHIVKIGDKIGQSNWEVEDISQSTVTLSKGESKKIITMSEE